MYLPDLYKTNLCKPLNTTTTKKYLPEVNFRNIEHHTNPPKLSNGLSIFSGEYPKNWYSKQQKNTWFWEPWAIPRCSMGLDSFIINFSHSWNIPVPWSVWSIHPGKSTCFTKKKLNWKGKSSESNLLFGSFPNRKIPLLLTHFPTKNRNGNKRPTRAPGLLRWELGS